MCCFDNPERGITSVPNPEFGAYRKTGDWLVRFRDYDGAPESDALYSHDNDEMDDPCSHVRMDITHGECAECGFTATEGCSWSILLWVPPHVGEIVEAANRSAIIRKPAARKIPTLTEGMECQRCDVVAEQDGPCQNLQCRMRAPQPATPAAQGDSEAS